MHAMMLNAPRPVVDAPLTAVNVPASPPGAGQILVRVTVCGVCHTDLHTVEGDLDLPTLPITPGHQVVGRVAARGVGANRFALGDRVGVAWLNWTCGECAQCRAGRENLCANARFTGLHAHGGYAETLVVDERFAFPLPAEFSDMAAAPLLCAGIIGYRSLKLCGIEPGGKLGLYGFGASAHLVIQVARHWGCAVYVFTRGEEHRRLARALGAVWAGGAEDEIKGELDAGITFAPVGSLIPLALRHLRPAGTLAINAVHLTPIPELPYERLYGERVLRSVANFTRQDAADFLHLAAEIPIRAEVEAFPLAQANEALLKLKNSQIKGAAALVVA
ncbi:MAG: zinc-dependent alcohol dehydrogenase family protein [Ardenticatenales bacterium]|nr:zinc-dependent alcohol dehydrogenase family protein [Ardenticatenales bacterium]